MRGQQQPGENSGWLRSARAVLNRPLSGTQLRAQPFVIAGWLKRYVIALVVINAGLFMPFVAFFGFAPIEKTGICVPGWRGYSLSYEILFVFVMLLALGLVPILIFLFRKTTLISLKIGAVGILLLLAGVYVPAAFGLFIPPDKISECGLSRSTHTIESVVQKP
jgi:hypothetical protein